MDSLDRLTGTTYHEVSRTESSTLDLVGNRESHTNRAEDTTAYGPANEANEYDDVDGKPVEYDEAGNLSVDEDSRQYTYDEQNRLIQIRAADDTVLANYTYDALGRRISFEDPVAGLATHYYYAGQSVIEERDASDVLVRYHVNGAQYLDERVATFDDSTGEFSYYLVNQNFSIAGTGNADGSQIERLDYSPGGDFASPGVTPSGGVGHDAEATRAVIYSRPVLAVDPPPRRVSQIPGLICPHALSPTAPESPGGCICPLLPHLVAGFSQRITPTAARLAS